MESRRAFLGRCGAGAAVWTALGAGGWSRRLGRRGGVRSRPAGRAGGVRDGAGQGRRGDLRRHPDQSLSQSGRRAFASRPTARRASRSRCRRSPTAASFGFGLRVLADGAWGFSASYDVTREAIARAAAEAVEIARANAPLRRRADRAGGDAVVPRYLPDQGRHRPVLRADRAEARTAPHRRDRGAQGRGRLLGDRVDRGAPRRPVLRLVRGERDRAARLPDRPRDPPRRPSRPAGRSSRGPIGRTRSAPATRPSSGPT